MLAVGFCARLKPGRDAQCLYGLHQEIRQDMLSRLEEKLDNALIMRSER